MKALCWYGIGDVRVENVPDPQIVNQRDAIVKITSSAICGSDLHLYDGYVPSMMPGDVLGHEFMGEVVEVGREVKKLQVGDRVVVPFTIACGNCWYCQHDQWSLCDNANPNAWMPEKLYGVAPGAYYGYSHAFGGYAGGQAQYARVPFADYGHIKIENGLTDEQVLFLSDILPTGYQAAEFCQIKPDDTIAVWGCGPVAQMAIRSAFMLGAGRVIAIDRFEERLQMARDGGAEVINYQEVDDVVELLKDMTGGRGPDACIEGVGMEAHTAATVVHTVDKVKQNLRLQTDRPHALRQAVQACGKGGVVSVPGVYAGFIDKFPMGAVFNKGLTIRAGQTHVQKYMPTLLQRIERGEIDPSFVITHRMTLEEAPHGYRIFRDKHDHCIKIVLKPQLG
jgi:threonine dehydrogenase-like Zn-dependent dehydrogenase